MEAWAFIFWVSTGNIYRDHANPARHVATQSEDSCILLAKTVTKGLPVDGMCVSEFEGKVLWFKAGRQVDKL